MKPITYERLYNSNGLFVGFKRTIIEYLSAGGNEWQLNPLDDDREQNRRITTPPTNIISMRRATIKNK